LNAAVLVGEREQTFKVLFDRRVAAAFVDLVQHDADSGGCNAHVVKEGQQRGDGFTLTTHTDCCGNYDVIELLMSAGLNKMVDEFFYVGCTDV
jgi:hypothetical protein